MVQQEKWANHFINSKKDKKGGGMNILIRAFSRFQLAEF